MNNNTPMQELIDRIEKFQGKNWIPKREKEKYLEKEKQMVIDVFEDGCGNQHQAENGIDCILDGEKYYTNTFNK